MTRGFLKADFANSLSHILGQKQHVICSCFQIMMLFPWDTEGSGTTLLMQASTNVERCGACATGDTPGISSLCLSVFGVA